MASAGATSSPSVVSALSATNASSSRSSNSVLSSAYKIVTPGESIGPQEGYLRGHGTYTENNRTLVASVCGVVERVNKLVKVDPLQSRYRGDVGDLVVGRVEEVGEKSWKVDVGGAKSAVLMLSSVNLPGGVQRRRTHEDQLQMRDLYVEGDLISAEVHQFYGDGALSLHTRSLKYGKLANGQFVRVRPSLIKRLKQHFFTLESCGVDVVLGMNGYIFITAHHHFDGADTQRYSAEKLLKEKEFRAQRVLSREDRLSICRVHNAILLLRELRTPVTPERIEAILESAASCGAEHPRDMLRPSYKEAIVKAVFSGADDDDGDGDSL